MQRRDPTILEQMQNNALIEQERLQREAAARARGLQRPPSQPNLHAGYAGAPPQNQPPMYPPQAVAAAVEQTRQAGARNAQAGFETLDGRRPSFTSAQAREARQSAAEIQRQLIQAQWRAQNDPTSGRRQ